MYRIIFSFLLLVAICSSGYAQKTVIHGQVEEWPSDSIYFCTLPFHSPHSYQVQAQKLKQNGAFRFEVESADPGFVAFLAPRERNVSSQIEHLLTNNLTGEHYWGHCRKVYTNGLTTLLLERGVTLEIELKYNSWPEKVSPKMYERLKNREGVTALGDNTLLQIGQCDVRFNHPEKEMFEFYQNSFDWDNKCDIALSRPSSKKVHRAVVNVKNVRDKLMADLEARQDLLTPFFYDYLAAEIEFGMRKEFLKYLKYDQETFLEGMISSEEIPQEIADLIALDPSLITEAALISEEFVEYAEFYLNYVLSLSERKYQDYHVFDMNKLTLSLEKLPKEYAYFYVANQLLQTDNPDEFKVIALRFLNQYPDGELNMRLKQLYE